MDHQRKAGKAGAAPQKHGVYLSMWDALHEVREADSAQEIAGRTGSHNTPELDTAQTLSSDSQLKGDLTNDRLNSDHHSG